MRGRLYRKLKKGGIVQRATWRRFEKEAQRREGIGWGWIVLGVSARSAARSFEGLRRAFERFA